jgi:hypothetical protein
VFVDGKCIGGGSDTVKMYKTGKLEEILKSDSVPDIRAPEAAAPNRRENPAHGFKSRFM